MGHTFDKKAFLLLILPLIEADSITVSPSKKVPPKKLCFE